MIKRFIKRSILKSEPYEKWNQFIDLISMEGYEDLTNIQRIAHLCFWYDSEVQNGGHIQYFTNREGNYFDETIKALDKIGAFKQKELLTKVVNLYNTLGLADINNSKDFISKVLVGYDYEFSDEHLEDTIDEYINNYDREYYNSEPTINDLLEKYLDVYEQSFIEVIEE